MRIIACALVIVLAASIGLADHITLATGGKPAATIVIPAQANDKERLAAEDLKHYVQAICGVELPINADGRAVTGTGLYVGNCEPTQDGDIPGGDLNPETYAITVRDGSIFFNGRYPTPTHFAVSTFIQDTLGVRWFAPGDEWEWVPEGAAGELSVEAESLTWTPTTSPRIWSGHQWTDDWKTWSLRNKSVVSEIVPRRQFQNRIHAVLPPSKYGESHPEYYPLIGRKRWVPPDDGFRYWRPCESNPEVQQVILDYIRAYFDANPTADSFSLGMDDISHLCGCENCRAWDPSPDSLEKRELSDRHYRFVNLIAGEIAKTHPDRYIGTLIYNIARNLPQNVDMLEPNVFGFITETSALWWQEGRKQADHDLTREWAKRCRHLSRYDYYGMGTMTPRVYPHAIDEQIKFDKSLGVEGMYIEVYTFLPNTAPMIYATARLQVDHTLDVDELLWDFYAKMYGPSARTMKDYYDLLERSWNTPREGRTGWVHRNLTMQALAMSPEDIDAGFVLLNRALAEADSELVRDRIKTVRAGLRYGSFPIKAYGLSQELGRLAVRDEASARRALEGAAEMGRLASDRVRFWEAALRRDDLLGANLRGLTEMGYLAGGQSATVEGGAWTAAVKALMWYSENAPDRLRAVTQDVIDSGRENEGSRLVSDWVWVLQNDAQNLLANSDFEDTGENTERAERDWATEGAPKGWSTWASGGRGVLGLAAAMGRAGSTAATIRDTGNACFLQGVPVKPGERYLLTGWVRAVNAEASAKVTLSIRYNKEGGGWHPRQDLEPRTAVDGDIGDWEPLVLTVTIPEGAVRLIVMPGANGLNGDAVALHDDIALYRLPE
ncbi:MAG TPA: hypothetical protein DGT21_03105 [Armatimonadetes bacterium]|nr:hypothetical protein [Armatimonadota bacterium]